MRVGIYLGRHAGEGGGIAVYAEALVRGVLELLEQEAYRDWEVVLYGDGKILTAELLEDFEISSVISSQVGVGMLFGAGRYFRPLPGGARCRLLVRMLPAGFGRWGAFVLDQLLLPVLFLRDGIELVHSVANYALLWTAKTQVVTVHDLFQAWPPEKRRGCGKVSGLLALRSRGIRWLYRRLFHRQFKIIDHAVTVSKGVAEEIYRRCGFGLEKISTIPSGIDDAFAGFIERIDKDPTLAGELEQFLQSAEIEPGYVLVFASSDPRKNMRKTLEAWKSLPEELRRKGLVLKAVDRGALGRAREILGTEYDKEYVFVLKWLDREELPYCYHLAGIVLFSTLAEGFGLPAAEALSLGKPLVVSNLELLGSCSLESSKVFLCDPGNEESIKAALLQAFEVVKRDLPKATGSQKTVRTMLDAARETVVVYKEVSVRSKKTV